MCARVAPVRCCREELGMYVRLGKKIPSDVLMSVSGIVDPHRLAESSASQPLSSFQEKQKLLEIFPVDQRLEASLGLLYRVGESLCLE